MPQTPSPSVAADAGRPRLAGRFLDSLQAVEKAIAVVAILGAAAALTVDLIGRELVGQGVFGAQRVAVHLTFIAGLLGFAVATGGGAHLRIKATDALLPARWTPAIERAGSIVSAVLLAGLAWYAGRFTLQTASVGERSTALGVPIWPFQAVMVWAFASSALRHLCYAVDLHLKPQEPSQS
jgi:TRAP-type C4-dicarboxylate transport system permease small subunit